MEAFVGLAYRKDSRIVKPLLEELAADNVDEMAIEAAGELGDSRLLPALLKLKDWWPGTPSGTRNCSTKQLQAVAAIANSTEAGFPRFRFWYLGFLSVGIGQGFPLLDELPELPSRVRSLSQSFIHPCRKLGGEKGNFASQERRDPLSPEVTSRARLHICREFLLEAVAVLVVEPQSFQPLYRGANALSALFENPGHQSPMLRQVLRGVRSLTIGRFRGFLRRFRPASEPRLQMPSRPPVLCILVLRSCE